ncbi:MAG: hypothetical protein H0V81_03035 [Solirubrobacterales bacterium]|nr:hypothetical protein [Solirubrobacterales bacterium]
MSTDPAPLTISDAVHRAVRVLDPSGTDQNLGELLGRFEDADEPIGVAAEAAQRIDEGVGALDPQAEDAAIQLAGAVARYLCFRRDEAVAEGNHLITLAVRAEYGGAPPEPMRGWLEEAGVAV